MIDVDWAWVLDPDRDVKMRLQGWALKKVVLYKRAEGGEEQWRLGWNGFKGLSHRAAPAATMGIDLCFWLQVFSSITF